MNLDDKGRLAALARLTELNVPVALERMSNIQSVYEDALRSLVNQVEPVCRQLSDSVNQSDAFAVHIHGIKGGLSTVGGLALAEMALRMEMAARKGEAYAHLLPPFLTRLKELGRKLDGILNGMAQDTKVLGDITSLPAKLQAIREGLELYELEQPMDLLNEVRHFTFTKAIDQQLKQLHTALSAIEYKAGIAIVDKLLPLCEQGQNDEDYEQQARAGIQLSDKPVSYLLWDAQKNLIDCNEDVLTMLGLTAKEDFIGHFFDFAPPKQAQLQLSKEAHRMNLDRAIRDSLHVCMWTFWDVNGHEISVEMTLILNKQKRQVQGFFVAE